MHCAARSRFCRALFCWIPTDMHMGVFHDTLVCAFRYQRRQHMARTHGFAGNAVSSACRKKGRMRRKPNQPLQRYLLIVLLITAVACSDDPAESKFLLADAYKTPPKEFTESRGHRLYGRVISAEGDPVGVATSPQDFDAMLDASRQHRSSLAAAQAEFDSAVKLYVARGMERHSRLDSLMPSGFRSDIFSDETRRLRLTADAMRIETPGCEAAIKAALRRYLAAMDVLMQRGVYFELDNNCRVRILDISDHYCKCRPLEGALRDRVVFILPKNILVK